VKQFVNLLPDAEPPEDLVENIFWIDPAGNPADRMGRPPDILGPKL
jgi:hypothetical protein